MVGGFSTAEALGSEYSKHTCGLFLARSALEGYVSPVVTSIVHPSSPGNGIKGDVTGVPCLLRDAYSHTRLLIIIGTSSSGIPMVLLNSRSFLK